MNGHVDTYGRALVTVKILSPDSATTREIQSWIDTGFNGELVLPQREIDDLALRHSGTVKGTLADGSEVAIKTYACLIDWFGDRRYLEVVANKGEYPLLGVGLLLRHDLGNDVRMHGSGRGNS